MSLKFSFSFCLQWLRVCYTLPSLYHQREWSESRRNKVCLLVLLLARSTGWRVGSFRSTPCLHPPLPYLVPVPTVAGLERFDLVLDGNCLLSVPWFSYRENTNYVSAYWDWEPLGFEQALLGESREVTREPLTKGTRVRGVEGFAARSFARSLVTLNGELAQARNRDRHRRVFLSWYFGICCTASTDKQTPDIFSNIFVTAYCFLFSSQSDSFADIFLRYLVNQQSIHKATCHK